MTLREIHVAMHQIDIRLHNVTALDAKFHGFKMPFRDTSTHSRDSEEITKEERQKVDDAMRQAIERRIQKGNGN